jgi:hypothetical protein
VQRKFLFSLAEGIDKVGRNALANIVYACLGMFARGSHYDAHVYHLCVQQRKLKAPNKLQIIEFSQEEIVLLERFEICMNDINSITYDDVCNIVASA